MYMNYGKCLPTAIGWRIFYFIASYILICIGIAISNRCKMPIVPTDLFPRELSQITSVAYPKIKISFDVICLIVTAALTGFGLGHIKGLGIGTVVALPLPWEKASESQGTGWINIWTLPRFLRNSRILYILI